MVTTTYGDPKSIRNDHRFLIILAMNELSEALYKDIRMGDDDEMGARVLTSSADAAKSILTIGS